MEGRRLSLLKQARSSRRRATSGFQLDEAALTSTCRVPDQALQLANANYLWIAGAMLFNLDYATTPWNLRTDV
jgi:hypothetical protein